MPSVPCALCHATCGMSDGVVCGLRCVMRGSRSRAHDTWCTTHDARHMTFGMQCRLASGPFG
eukprot:9734412-Lingulodinium_polyedra.AAC.1